MTREEMLSKLKTYILDDLYLEDIDADELNETTPLFGSGLGLDSIDAVELVVMVEKYFGVSIKDADEAKAAFANLGVLVDFIRQRQPE